MIEEEVERTLAAVRTRLDVTDLRIAFRPELSGVIPELGIGGYNPSADEVRIYLDPSDPGIPGIVRDEQLRILSHEIHHALRRTTVGYGSTLFHAAVTEGLADHFALEVGGGEPAPWSVALTPEELEEWMPEVLAGTGSGYDHEEWFFGTSPSIPRWTGYAVGFELVGIYLDAHPGSSASGLVGEPADSFRWRGHPSVR
ncbi:MAG: peptidase [Gemmatimonadetes bacterium]|nr:peptidase [Gemmatimonadota bacterium]